MPARTLAYSVVALPVCLPIAAFTGLTALTLLSEAAGNVGRDGTGVLLVAAAILLVGFAFTARGAAVAIFSLRMRRRD